MDQQLHTLQVPGQDSLMNSSHTYMQEQGKVFNSSHACGLVSKAAVTLSLTGEVDGVQADSPGSDEASDPLQLPVFHIVLEDNVIGEMHIADRLGSGWAFAAG